MLIRCIEINNIRGLKHLKLTLNTEGNKPLFIYAPNGGGKSSFALAFDSLRPKGIRIEDDDKYEGKNYLKPEIIIKTDDSFKTSYEANISKNEISKKFDVIVINNRLSSTITKRNTQYAKSFISVKKITLEKSIPEKCKINYSFLSQNSLIFKQGVFPSISKFIENKSLYLRFPIKEISSCNNFNCNLKNCLNELKKIQKMDSSKIKLKQYISTYIENIFKDFDFFKKIIKLVTEINTNLSPDNLTLTSLQLLFLYHQENKNFLKNKKFFEYCERESAYNNLINSLNTSWKKDIKTKKFCIDKSRNKYELALILPTAKELSNGERDVIVLAILLEKAKYFFTKQFNILIIDEVFDYLDDANHLIAQYFVSGLIASKKREKKQIFPFLLTHLNPEYFKIYGFSKLKVYFLNKQRVIKISKYYNSQLVNLKTLLLSRNKARNAEATDLISEYYLHFNTDQYKNIQNKLNSMGVHVEWENYKSFSDYCRDNLHSYLKNEWYSAFAIAIILRLFIEEYCYTLFRKHTPLSNFDYFSKNISGGSQKLFNFLDCEKIHYPEIFKILGLIYNPYLHAKSEEEYNIAEVRLKSILENKIIHKMIVELVGIYYDQARYLLSFSGNQLTLGLIGHKSS